MLDLISTSHGWPWPWPRSPPFLPGLLPPATARAHIDHVDRWRVASASRSRAFRPACRLPAGRASAIWGAAASIDRPASSEPAMAGESEPPPPPPPPRAACRPIAGLRIPRLVTFVPYPSTCGHRSHAALLFGYCLRVQLAVYSWLYSSTLAGKS